MTKVLTIRIKNTTHKKLQELAEQDGRTLNNLLNKIIKDIIDASANNPQINP